ncbi:ABC transporter permease [Fulvivirga sp. 29W222]|uniref:ABC transporter permease n=1 Tax=Fulvivirga marina TaxID=2494733 RepID=A0A937KD42_9BACT|nr:ABC transporter permease [Fulvivirga marina]MBL6448084.1 ABC transporter permease [Fulvivirga marina]
MWLKLAWKNLWRNKHRTAITTAAIFFAVILSVAASSLQDGVFDNFIKNMVSYYTGYIQIHQKGYWNHQVLDNGMIRDSSYESRISNQKNITAIAPRIESYALASFKDLTKGCMVVGIHPEEENKITALQNKVTSGKYFDHKSGNTVILSEGLAERFGLQVNDTVYLISQGYHGALAAGKYLINGIVSFGSPELNDQLLFMPLHTAQEFYSAPDLVTSYVLGLKSDKYLGSTVSKLRHISGETYEVMSWKELLPDVDQHIKMDKGSMSIILGILYLLICFGIFGTMLMMMVERRYEVGMLVAIGMKKGILAMLFLTESIFTVIIGSVAGLSCSIPLVYYLKEHPIRIGGEMAETYERFNFEPIFPASTDPSIFITQGLIVVSIGLLLSMYPVITVFKIDPVKAMKK